jgi:hypothetical protein
MHIEIYCLLNREQNQADRARRHVVNWALEFSAFYPGKKRKQPRGQTARDARALRKANPQITNLTAD